MEVGIDFGTTFSTIAYSDVTKGEQSCLSLSGSVFIPTELFIYPDGSYSIGYRARTAYLAGEAGGLFVNPKRWVGANKRNMAKFVRSLRPDHVVSEDGSFSVKLGDLGNRTSERLPVLVVIALFISAMIKELEDYTSSKVRGVVCSVPAKYNSYKRSYLKTALESLGIPLRALVNEPTAAVIFGIGAMTGEDGLYGVFDFGGGTFDVSYALKYKNIIGIIGSEGDNYLGGRDIDKAILKTVKARLRGVADESKLSIIVSGIKEDLSSDVSKDSFFVSTNIGLETIRYGIADLNEDCLPYVSRAINIFIEGARKLSFANMSVVLTGGSSALPLVQSMVRDLSFTKSVIFDKSYFRASVALGAKVYSDVLSGKSEIRLIDCLSQSLSDEYPLMRGQVIFPKGSVIPNVHKSSVTGSGNVPFGVFEGEAPITWKNEMTYKSAYNNTSGGSMSVVYELSIDGLLSVTVNGSKLVNVYTLPALTKEQLSYRYSLSKDKYDKVADKLYLDIYNKAHSKNLSLEQLTSGDQYPFEDIDKRNLSRLTPLK